MSKFEWVELETSSAEVAQLQSRIDAARVTKNYGLVQLLEREIGVATERRNRVLADITKGLSNAVPAGQRPIESPVQEVHFEPPEEKQEPAIRIETDVSDMVSSTNPRVRTDENGDLRMWDKLTADDIERVKRGFATRRAEMLARHAEELQGLETQEAEINGVEKAIAVFMQKFKLTSSADVVPFDGDGRRSMPDNCFVASGGAH
jgi:hypothetical protein